MNNDSVRKTLQIYELFQELCEVVHVDQDISKIFRNPRRFRNRGYAITEMEALDDNKFQRMFRVSRNGFQLLLQLISPKFEELCSKFEYYR